MKPEKVQFEEGKSPLKTLRELLGNISQEDLAHLIGVTTVTISRWERGVTPATFTIPQMKSFIRLLKEVNWDIEELPDSFAVSHQKISQNSERA